MGINCFAMGNASPRSIRRLHANGGLVKKKLCSRVLIPRTIDFIVILWIILFTLLVLFHITWLSALVWIILFSFLITIF